MSRQDWTPTGELVSSDEVRIYSSTVYTDSKPEKIRIRLVGRRERWLSFPTVTARNAELTLLEQARDKGERWDAGSNKPVSMSPAPAAAKPAADPTGGSNTRWLEFAYEHVDQSAAVSKRKTSESRFEALRISCWILIDDDPGHPGKDALKLFLDVALKPCWAADPNDSPARQRATRAEQRSRRLARLDEPTQAAGRWLAEHSLPFTQIDSQRALDVLNAFKLTLKGKKAAATTRNRKRNAFRKALADAVTAKHLTLNPMNLLDRRTYASAKLRVVDRRVVMNPVQCEAFLYNLGHDADDGDLEDDDRYTAFFALMLNDGLRPSEAVAANLGWCDLPGKGWGLIDLQHAIVFGSTAWGDSDQDDQETTAAGDGQAYSIEPIKWTDHAGTETTRPVPLCPDSVARLARQEQRYGVAPDGRFFSARDGGPINPSLLRRLVHKARDRTFADPASPHYIKQATHPLRTMTSYACRHTAASIMLNAGVSPKLVADRLGHLVQVLLTIYASVTSGDDEVANERIDRHRREALKKARKKAAATAGALPSPSRAA